mgnify:CR=1 FL=1
MLPPIQGSLPGDRNVTPGTSPGSGPSGMPDILKKIILQKMLSSRPVQGRPMGGGR